MVKISDEGKVAITVFEVVERFSNCTLLKANLITGRTHQIRVHANALGHPIAGDEKYGDKGFNQFIKNYGCNRLFLHAEKIKIKEDENFPELEFKAQMDNKLTRLLEKLQQSPL